VWAGATPAEGARRRREGGARRERAEALEEAVGGGDDALERLDDDPWTDRKTGLLVHPTASGAAAPML
jgi:hypothetical protein